MRKIILGVFITAVCIFGASSIHAQCSCHPRDITHSAHGALKNADVVFVGEVIEVKKVVSKYYPPEGTFYYEFDVKFKVKTAWKTDLSPTITIRNTNAGSADFNQGESYLIYARVYYDDNVLRAHIGCCNRSKLLSEAAEDIKEFKARGEKLMNISETSTSKVRANPNKSLQPTPQ